MATSKTITDLHTQFIDQCYDKSTDLAEQITKYKTCHKLVTEMDQKIQEMKQRVQDLDTTNVEETRLSQVREWIRLLEAPGIEFNQLIEIVETIASFRNSLPVAKSVTTVNTNDDLIHEADGDDLFDDID